MQPADLLLDRITTDPRVLAGKPVGRGLRSLVEQLLKAWAAGRKPTCCASTRAGAGRLSGRATVCGRCRAGATALPPRGRMQFIVDVGVGRSAAQQLAADGYTVLPVRERNPRMADEELVDWAHREQPIVVDFGDLERF